MTQQNNQITDQDLQMLLAQNPLAAEQLRRIIAERLVVELQTELATRNGSVDALAAVEAGDAG
jgi:phosphate starvation-inducible protein PhoH